MTIVDQQHQKEGEGALAVGWAQHGFVADSVAERGVGDNSLSWSFKVRSKTIIIMRHSRRGFSVGPN